MSRRSLPTSSIWCSAPSSRMRSKFSPPARFSAIHSRGELARLDFVEDLLHRRPRLLADHPFAAGHVAVLGGVGDRVAHPLDPLLVHQVDDQLQLVQALEVGEARVVAGLDQGLEAGLDQLGGAAAEHRLLAEEVGLALVLEGRLDDRRRGRRRSRRRRRGRARGRRRSRPGGRPSGRARRGLPRTGGGPGGPGPSARPCRRRRRRAARSGRSGSRTRGRTSAGCPRRSRRRSRPPRSRPASRRAGGPSRCRRGSRLRRCRAPRARPPRPCARLAESGRRPTTTSTPESFRLSAWAWPWEP